MNAYYSPGLLVVGLLVVLGLVFSLWMIPERHRGYLALGLVLLAGPVLLWLLYRSLASPRPAAVQQVQTDLMHEMALAHEQHEIHHDTHFHAPQRPAWTRGPSGDELVALFSTIFGLFGALWLTSRLFDRGSKMYGGDRG